MPRRDRVDHQTTNHPTCCNHLEEKRAFLCGMGRVRLHSIESFHDHGNNHIERSDEKSTNFHMAQTSNVKGD